MVGGEAEEETGEEVEDKAEDEAIRKVDRRLTGLPGKYSYVSSLQVACSLMCTCNRLYLHC